MLWTSSLGHGSEGSGFNQVLLSETEVWEQPGVKAPPPPLLNRQQQEKGEKR